MSSARAWRVALSFVGLVTACGIDTIPEGAQRTPPGDGPVVVFEPTRRPLPEIPQPNDVATFADPTSRTGRRINVSMVAPTRLEGIARAGFNQLEGWGTFAPITVAFQRGANRPEGEPALDLDGIAARTRTWDPADDPFYLVDLTTGVPVPLDMGKGSFPLAIVDPDKYWPNDAKRSERTLLFETVEEGAGLPPGAYRPALDQDFDGVLDHPNVLRPSGANARIEDVIPWYERESDTLILRPLVPLEEMHEYAVVLTDRLTGPDGKPVRSPFASIHHAQQRRGAERVREIFADGGKRNWYGELAGSGLSHVAFTWTFTTQPVFDDMRRLRDGLHGQGPFAKLATDFPAEAKAFRTAGLAVELEDEPNIPDSPVCAAAKKHPFTVKTVDARETFKSFLGTILGLKGAALDLFVTNLEAVDHFVIGEYEAPYFMGDPEHESPDGRFELDYVSGTGRVARDKVQFWLSVPKATAAFKQPFPTTVWAHGTTLHADEMVIRAGWFAKQGIAVMGINMPGHGLYLEKGQQTLAEVFLRTSCNVPVVKAMTTGRHRDLNDDGVPDSGGLLWSAHLFHSRDNIRQSVLDEIQATRILRTFDGVRRGTQDTNGDGSPDLAGDFDGDGTPDVGGPNVPITTAGNSFGGLLAMVHGAVDPNVSATVAISGGGGLTDIATRSALVPDSVLQQIYSPLVVAIPAKDLPPDGTTPRTQCTGDQRSVRFVVNDLLVSKDVEIACLPPNELDRDKTVVVENLRNGEKRCARTKELGRFRVPIPADRGDRLDVQIYDAPDTVVSYKGCEIVPGAPVGRRIKTFEQAAVLNTPVGNPEKTCDAAFAASGLEENRGCAQYRDVFFPVGAPLVAPQEGLGLTRQTPEARRLLALVQAAIDPADPINFAPYFGIRAAPGIDGKPMGPRGILSSGTLGDPFVPIGSSYAFARAAGAVPFLPPEMADSHPAWAEYATPRGLHAALGQKTPQEVLLDGWVLEGVHGLARTRGGPACAPNYTKSNVCTDTLGSDVCKNALHDPDWLSEGANKWDAPHPAVPLRLTRAADVRVDSAASLDRAWAPRLAGAPSADDERAWRGDAPLVGVLGAYINPDQAHVFVTADPCRAFDETRYHVNLMVRYLATRGRDLYVVSHPRTHRCLERDTCPFF